MFRIKPDEKYYKFSGPKYEEGTMWSSPYFWCPDPTNWMVTAMTPIWATNDREYKNKLFATDSPLRYVGLSEIVLNYEEADVNQCPGDRQINAFYGTALCDSTSECLPLPFFGLNQGGYECQCMSGYHYPKDFQGPYLGVRLSNADAYTYPLCVKSEGLLQYPNWISKNGVEFMVPNTGTYVDESIYYPIRSKRNAADSVLDASLDNLTQSKKKKKVKNKKRKKRFLDKRNNFEKLRDSIFGDQEHLRRKCLSSPFQDIILLNEDDERFIVNLRNHANEVFKPQTAQAVRIAHILSSYLQLHSPIASSSVNYQNDYSPFNKLGDTLRPDPQLDEYTVIGEIMSTLQAHYPLQEVNVFFNGTEYNRQKFFSGQNTLAFGISMIRSDIETFLNRSNDNSHLSKTWYLDAINRFTYGGGQTKFGGYYPDEFERKYYESAGPFDSNTMSSNFKFDRFSIEMSLRKTFDGMQGSISLPTKSYDAPTSGVWFGPYFDCQKRYMKTKTTLRLSYAVPIITSMTKLPV